MPISVLTTLPRPRWRLLILLEHYRNRSSRRRALPMLLAASADVDDLVAVEAAGLVEASARINGELVHHSVADDVTRNGVTGARLTDVHLDLTRAGVNWLAGNPAHQAVAVLAESRHGRPLREVLSAADTDVSTIAALYDLGVAEVYDEHGRMIVPSGLGHTSIRPSGWYEVRLTAKGRDLTRT